MDKLCTGTDIESIARFAGKDRNDAFMERLFTAAELDYCFTKKNPAPHLAARYAGKEAIIKAVSGMGRGNLVSHDIEIANEENGAPRAQINRPGYEDLSISISLSHSREMAVALVVVTGDRELLTSDF